ncbi:hypothetical protein CDV31_000276 [Fusarium ambrosium]|uniref:Heterokaryon incompatibility domain-containing protein n=1 Tax=Fusarium ambrosium TaxID=131363 RepID=A0A428V315_9HYPO|nr:hypothetical protein CDV31_000276 [Fusarium ambrosium]
MAPRLYFRLPEGRFRLIKLLPGKWDDELEAELFEADQTFEYTALSYTWGSRKALRKVTLNGISRGITVNLDLALRTLRSTRNPVTVWADALCIDQEDVEDKSAQVDLMNDIFGWASQVRAYVGDPLLREHASFETRLEELGPLETFEYSDDEDEAWEEIHSALLELEMSKSVEISAHQQCRCIFGLLRALSSPTLTAKLQDMDLFSKKLTPKMELKQRNLFEWLRIFVVAPWWDRMWITQEVGVARELVLSYGKVTMSFNMLASIVGAKLPHLAAENARVVNLLVTKLKTISELRRLQRYESIAEMRDLDYFQRSLGSPLLWLLRTFRHRHSSEPRDKIYALARLLTKLDMGSKYKLRTDYSTSVATLFCRVAVLIMQETGLFWITSADLVAKSRDNLPSWVPNWTDGFTTPDTENMAWKIRLCHNVSKISFSVEVPYPLVIPMEPSKYYSRLAADAESYSWKRHQGGEQKFNEPFTPAVEAGRDAFMHSRHFFLDKDNSEPRRIWYEHHEPEVRDFTKVENCLKVPSQFCSTVRHVSEPIRPDLSNLQAIVMGLRVAHFKIFPDDWKNAEPSRLEQIGRVLCFGAVIDQQSGHARRLESYDDPDLAILVQVLTRADEDLQDSEGWEVWYRQKMLLELRSPCSVCRSATHPCSECTRQSEAKPIPTPKEARKDPNIKQLRQTAKQTAPGNCILMTRDGTFALGPPQSQVGDRISILSGGLCPYVLRRDTNPQHLGYLAFQLIGDCFPDKTPTWDTEKLETVALV